MQVPKAVRIGVLGVLKTKRPLLACRASLVANIRGNLSELVKNAKVGNNVQFGNKVTSSCKV